MFAHRNSLQAKSKQNGGVERLGWNKRSGERGRGRGETEEAGEGKGWKRERARGEREWEEGRGGEGTAHGAIHGDGMMTADHKQSYTDCVKSEGETGQLWGEGGGSLLARVGPH